VVATLKSQNIDVLHEPNDEDCSSSIVSQDYKANSKNCLISKTPSQVSHANHDKRSLLLKQVFETFARQVSLKPSQEASRNHLASFLLRSRPKLMDPQAINSKIQSSGTKLQLSNKIHESPFF